MDQLFTFTNVKISDKVTLKRAVRLVTRNDGTVYYAFRCQETLLTFMPLDKAQAMVVSGTIFDRSMAYSSYAKQRLQLAKLYGAEHLVAIFSSYSSFAFNCRLETVVRRFARDNMMPVDAVCDGIRAFCVLKMDSIEAADAVSMQKVPRLVDKTGIKLCPPSQYSKLSKTKIFVKLPSGERVHLAYGTPSGHVSVRVQIDADSECSVKQFETLFRKSAISAHIPIVATTRTGTTTYRHNIAGAPPAQAKSVVNETAVYKRRTPGTGKRVTVGGAKPAAKKPRKLVVASKSNDDDDDNDSQDDVEIDDDDDDDDSGDYQIKTNDDDDTVETLDTKTEAPLLLPKPLLTLEAARVALTPAIVLSNSDESHVVRVHVDISNEQLEAIGELARTDNYATHDQRCFFKFVNPQLLSGATDEVLIPATALGAKAWREVQAALRTTRWTDFVLGVQRGFNQMLRTGTVPQRTPCVAGAMAFNDPLRTNAATPALRRIAERFVYDDGTSIIMWGVQAMRDLPAGTDLGAYGGRRVSSKLEVHGEEALYRSAGISALEAEDGYSVEYKDANDNSVISTTREDDRSLLSLINHCAAQANCHFVPGTDHIVVGVIDTKTGAVRGDIQAGECLYISYGREYISRALAVGMRLARPGGIAEYEVVEPQPQPVVAAPERFAAEVDAARALLEPEPEPSQPAVPPPPAQESANDDSDDFVWPPLEDSSDSVDPADQCDYEFDDDTNDIMLKNLGVGKRVQPMAHGFTVSVESSPIKPTRYDDSVCATKADQTVLHPAYFASSSAANDEDFLAEFGGVFG